MIRMKMRIENKYSVQRFLPILSILLSGMAGCSDGDGQYLYKEEQELMLHAFSEKQLSETSFTDYVFFAKGNESGKYTEVWKASVMKDGRTVMTEPKFYPSDNSRIYLCGFAPEGKLTGDGQITWVINGRQDIMVTDEQNGSLTDMFWQERKTFSFIHLLTQLRFRLCCDEEGKAQEWKLLNVEVEGLQREAVLSLVDKSVSFGGEKGMLTVLNRMEEDENLILTTNWINIKDVVMIQPGIAVNLMITVENKDGNKMCFKHLPVTFHEDDNLSVAGTSYLLSVKLRAKDKISLSVAVVPWKTGASGSGTITEE